MTGTTLAGKACKHEKGPLQLGVQTQSNVGCQELNEQGLCTEGPLILWEMRQVTDDSHLLRPQFPVLLQF